MPLSEMVRFSHLDDRFRNGGKLTPEEKADYLRILFAFLEDFRAEDPEGYEKEYGRYEVTREEIWSSTP